MLNGGLRLLLLSAAAGLAAHKLFAAAARTRNRQMAARLDAAANQPETPSATVPALVHNASMGAVGTTPAPRHIHLRQRGTMRLSERGAWRSFTASQTITIAAPGFIWVANMQIPPLMQIQITDALVDGTGWLDARLFGSLPVARSSGPEVSLGELMRYLAELPWAPHALLHNRHLAFREVAHDTVEVGSPRADSPARVRLVLAGTDIRRIEADARPRMEGRQIVPRPWVGHYSDWREFEGVRVPTRASVSWILPNGTFECWRGEVTAWTGVPTL